MHKDLTKNLAAAVEGVSKRGRDKSKEDFPAKNGRQLCVEESFSNKDKFHSEVARKMWSRYKVLNRIKLI